MFDTESIANIVVQDTMKHQPEYAICVRDARKQYGTKNKPIVVLDGLNMTVPRGSIYGLLGASGCGKTTLLSCIVGRRRLNSGHIWALGGRPGSRASGVPGPRYGYMPQDVALYREFTIREMLTFFGWMAGVSVGLIEQRIEFVMELLRLPDQGSYINQLSGGQQRRTSLAVVLIHDPELLILDEPTVGVDPVLRRDIWGHLVQMASTGTRTIIITTHYIEEARQADLVGLMRGGKLLAEESPDALMDQFECSQLEDVFLKLSVGQNSGQHTDSIGVDNVEPTDESTSRIPSNTGKLLIIRLNRLKVLIWKNCLWMRRNILMMVFMMSLPCAQMIMFCLAIGHEPTNLRLSVVNMESEAVSVHSSVPDLLSIRYLRLLQKRGFSYDLYDNEAEAEEEVRRGRSWGSMVIESDFTESMLAMNLDHPKIVVRLDMSNQPISVILRKQIVCSFFDLTEELLNSMNINPKIGRPALTINPPIYGVPVDQSRYINFAAPGMLLSIMFFQSVAIAAGAMLSERNQGMLERCLVSGVTAAEILAAHMVTQVAVLSCCTLLETICGFVIFDLALAGPFMSVVYLSMLAGFSGLCFGLVAAAACDNERSATLMTLGIFMPIVMVSEIMWPLEGMHATLRSVAMFLPLTQSTKSMRCVTQKGMSVLDRDVYLGCVSLAAWSVVFVGICMLVLRIRKG